MSLEVHCSIPQQEKMAAYFIEIFGDKLVHGPSEICNGNVLKSPNELRGKIILKGLREKPANQMRELLHQDSATQMVNLEEQKQRAEQTISRTINQVTTGQYVEQNTDNKVAKALSDIVSLSIVPFQGFDQPLECYEMYNYSENSLETLVCYGYTY